MEDRMDGGAGEYGGQGGASSQGAASYMCGAARALPIISRGSWDGAGAAGRIFEWAGGERFSPAKARRGFLVYDASNPGVRESYKLPFADVENGRLVAVDAGLRAAAQMLSKTNVSPMALEHAQQVLNMYMGKLNKPAKPPLPHDSGGAKPPLPAAAQPLKMGMAEASYRMALAGQVTGQAGDDEFDVQVIRAGLANGWEWTGEALEEAVERGLFNDLSSFVDHRQDPTIIGRSVQDLCGVVYDAAYDPERRQVLARFRPTGPKGPLASQVMREHLADRAAGEPVPPVGLSIDVSFGAKGKRVERIAKVHSADFVWNPAAGGVIQARLATDETEVDEAGEAEGVMETQVDTSVEEEAVMSERETGQGVQSQAAVPQEAVEAFERDAAQARALLAQQQALVEQHQALLLKQCEMSLNATLASSQLPAPLQEQVRQRFAGRIFQPTDLADALEAQRALWAQLAEAGAVRGMGAGSEPANGGRPVRAAVLGGMWTDLERVELAFHRLMGLPLPETVSDVPKLSGIREFYHLLTGDLDLYGVYNAERAAFANGNATTMAGIVANVLNKVIPARAAELGREGYDWWKRIVHEEDFQTLQSISWLTVGGFGDLPTVTEGGAYTELAWDDNAETTTWTKKGGYIGLTLEMIDRDETQRVKKIPDLLATAAVRTLSASVAAIFTQASGAGPTLADSVALFHASSHGANLITTALSVSSWETAVQTMYKQQELNSNRRFGIRPKYLLVPIELEKTAIQVFGSVEPTANAFYENVRKGSGEVVVVPDWTDANDWAAVGDPKIAPGIGVGYRFGRQPEVFVADQPEVGSMFTNDELRVKCRFFYGVGVIDYRPLFKSNV